MIQGQFRFIIETFFELMISSVLVIGMWRTKPIWNIPDKICVSVQILLLSLCTFFAIFIVYFTSYMIRPLLKLKQKNREIWYKVNYKFSMAIKGKL